ncbi:MAG: FAD-binding oxidoreductase, partial [Cyanobacteria bacterium J083]
SGVLKLPHAQINPAQTNLAYQQAFLRQGGHRTIALVRNLLTSANTIRGVETNLGNFYAANTVICAGGLTRRLLPTENLNLPLYFTYAQLIKTPPVTTQLNSLIMPAVQARFTLEAQASQLDWLSLEQDNIPNSAKIPPILDIGAAQFKDGSICLGQISGIPANLGIELDLQQAEAKIRQGIANILPSLANLPGKCHQCLVAFTHPGIAVIGQLPQHPGGYIFSGFTSALLYTPPLARRFAQWATGQTDQIIAKLTASLN